MNFEAPKRHSKFQNIASLFLGGFIKDFLFVKRALLIAMAIATFLYLSFISLLYHEQENLIFIPSKEFPKALDIKGFESTPIEFNWKDGIAKGFHYHLEDSDKVTLFFYGNAQSVLKTVDRVIWFSEIIKTSFIVVDYPGYGESDGKPGQDSIDQWLIGYDDLLTNSLGYKKEERLIWGLSLGGAVAARMAKEHGCHALILESTFSSLTKLTSELYPIVPISWLLKHPFPTLSHLKNNFNSPIYLIHCEDDLIVDVSHAYRMRDQGGWPLLIINGGHSSGYRKYKAQISNFIEPALKDWH